MSTDTLKPFYTPELSLAGAERARTELPWQPPQAPNEPWGLFAHRTSGTDKK